MSARSARMNDDFSEMKVLARQLWRYLGRNDLALVLRARADTSTKEGGGLFSSGDEQLFLLTCEEVVQKPPQDASDVSKALHIMPDKNCQGESPCHGMLFRYATQTQMLREYLICLSCFLYFRWGTRHNSIQLTYFLFKHGTNNNLVTGFGNEGKSLEVEENSDGASEQYFNYISDSLDTLINTGLNPLLVGKPGMSN